VPGALILLPPGLADQQYQFAVRIYLVNYIVRTITGKYKFVTGCKCQIGCYPWLVVVFKCHWCCRSAPHML